jgi:hypothetical protein
MLANPRRRCLSGRSVLSQSRGSQAASILSRARPTLEARSRPHDHPASDRERLFRIPKRHQHPRAPVSEERVVRAFLQLRSCSERQMPDDANSTRTSLGPESSTLTVSTTRGSFLANAIAASGFDWQTSGWPELFRLNTCPFDHVSPTHEFITDVPSQFFGSSSCS